MIQLNLVVFLLLIEALVIVAALLLIWIIRSRKLTSALLAAILRVKALIKRPDARQYLLTESNITRDYLRALGEHDELMNKLLTLRADFLQLEYESADMNSHDQAYWENLSKKLDVIMVSPEVKELVLDRKQPLDKDGEPAAEMSKTKDLFNEQTSVIKQLKKQVRDVMGDASKAEQLEKQIDRISSANRELSYCVTTLESEISMLRDKIKLLEQQAKPGNRAAS